MIRKIPNPMFNFGLFSLTEGSYRRILKYMFWLLIPILLWWSLRDLSLAEVSINLRMVGLEAILILIAFNVLIFGLFSLRWWLILRAQGYKLSFISVISYRLSGFGVTYFTPGPQFGGEPLQVYLLNQREGIDTSAAAASVTVDKLLELLANFTFLLVGVVVLVFGGFLVGMISAGLIVFPFILLVLPAIYLIALWKRKFPISSIVRKLEERFPNHARLHRIHNTLLETEKLVSKFCRENTLALLAATILSYGTWILVVFEFSLMLRYLGVSLSLAQV